MKFLKLPGFSRKSVSIYIILAFLLGGASTSLLRRYTRDGEVDQPTGPLHTSLHGYTMQHIGGYKKVRPILGLERKTESRRLQPLKAELQARIDALKANGTIGEAAVYLLDLDHGRWMAINPEQKFHPASLMKVSLLLAYLRLAEATPGLLQQQVAYTAPPSGAINPQFYRDKEIEVGKTYTVHELLYYMIAYSDNNATWLLASRIDPGITQKLFADLGLPAPIADELRFTMTPRQISTLFQAIYSSAYFSPEYAEYAADLLSNCSFAEGFAKGFPANTPLWHKFGEWRHEGQDFELHESGVVTINGTPYVLTVMTRGQDTKKLAETIQAIARQVHLGVTGP